MNNPSKLLPAIWGGVFIGIISSVPILNMVNCACCAGVIGGGVFAVYMYRRDAGPYLDISTSDGVVLGLIAGVFGAVISAVLGLVMGTASLEMVQSLQEYIDNPEALEMLEEIQASGMSPVIFFFSLVMSLVVNSIFGLLGGLIGVSFWGQGKLDPNAEIDA